MAVDLNRFEPLYADMGRWLEPEAEHTGLSEDTMQACFGGLQRVYASHRLKQFGEAEGLDYNPPVGDDEVSLLHFVVAFHHEASRDPDEAEITFGTEEKRMGPALSLAIRTGHIKRPVGFDPGMPGEATTHFFRVMVPVLEVALGAPDDTILDPREPWSPHEQSVGGWVLRRTTNDDSDLLIASKARGVIVEAAS